MAFNPSDKYVNITLTNSDRTAQTSGGWSMVRGTHGHTTGKWYYEAVVDVLTYNANGVVLGLSNTATAITAITAYPGSVTKSFGHSSGAALYNNGGGSGGTLFAFTTGDILGFALDADANTCQVYKNNTLFSTQSSLPDEIWYAALGLYDSTGRVTINSTAADLFYTPPSGYTAWDESVPVIGTLAATDPADISAFAGTVPHIASIAATEASDIAVILGDTGAVSGYIVTTEATDTAALIGSIGVLLGTPMSGAFSLPKLTVTGGMQNLVLPILTATGEILPGNVTKIVTLDLPGLTATATILNGSVYAGDVALPMLSVTADFGINADLRLPQLTTSGSILSGNTLRAASSLPALAVAANLVSDGLAAVDASLPGLTLAADILGGGSMSAAVSLPRLALAISGYSGSVSTASVSLPAFEVSGEIWGEYIGQAAIELPMLTLVATFADKTTTTTTAFVMNTKTGALTQYSNFNYNSATNFNGVDLVASSAGIFALAGDLDGAALIDAYARLGTTDFGTAVHKRVEAAYLGYRSNGGMRLRVITDEQETYDYILASNDVNSIHGNRVKMGQGMKGTYWQVEVGNVGGASFEIDSLHMVAKPLSRKVY